MIRKFHRTYEKIIEFINDRLNPQQFLLLSSFLVGLTAAMAAIVLKLIVYYLHDLITYNSRFTSYGSFLYLFFPLVGIFLTVFIIKRFFGGKLEKGNSVIIYAIHKKSAIIDKVHMYAHVITSAFTVGFGGSTGLESPIVLTGSAIGSNYARTYQISYKDRLLLIASGAAAGIGAAFNAPISGVLFAFEVLLANASVSAFIPIIIASATGAILSKIILNESILLNFKLKEAFNYHNIPYYIILAVICGFVSVCYAKIFTSTEEYFKKLRINRFTKAIIGGILVALLCLFLPPLFGEGYESIKNLAELHPEKLIERSILRDYITGPWLMIAFLALVFIVKAVAVGITLGTGGIGGNFAPSLLVGAFLGFTFSFSLQQLGFENIPSNNFCLVAMAGILSGVFHAPLAGIFLIAEITGGYELFIPLMIVSAISYLISRYFDKHSMDNKKLALKGIFKKENIDDLALRSIKTHEITETNYTVVNESLELKKLIETIIHSDELVYFVTNDEQKLTGLVHVENIKKYLVDSESHKELMVKNIATPAAALILEGEPMQAVMKKFESTSTWILPVVDVNLVYKGSITRQRIFEHYRNKVVKFKNENKDIL